MLTNKHPYTELGVTAISMTHRLDYHTSAQQLIQLLQTHNNNGANLTVPAGMSEPTPGPNLAQQALVLLQHTLELDIHDLNLVAERTDLPAETAQQLSRHTQALLHIGQLRQLLDVDQQPGDQTLNAPLATELPDNTPEPQTNEPPTPVSLPPNQEYTVYTDGSCHRNPGPGGYAAVFVSNGQTVHQISDSDAETTSSRMELSAPTQALAIVQDGATVHIISDSMYLVDAFNKGWIANWQSNGWQTANNKAVKNQDLWESLLEQVERHQKVTFTWVKGHDGNEFNELADALANAQADSVDTTSSTSPTTAF